MIKITLQTRGIFFENISGFTLDKGGIMAYSKGMGSGKQLTKEKTMSKNEAIENAIRYMERYLKTSNADECVPYEFRSVVMTIDSLMEIIEK